MKLKISFKNLSHTEALDGRIKEKSEKFTKYFEGNTNINWFCGVHNGEHWAEIKFHGPKFSFFAKASSDNLYKCLDLVVEKMERQIEKQKDQKKDKLHKHAYQTPKYIGIDQAIRDEEAAYNKDFEEKSA